MEFRDCTVDFQQRNLWDNYVMVNDAGGKAKERYSLEEFRKQFTYIPDSMKKYLNARFEKMLKLDRGARLITLDTWETASLVEFFDKFLDIYICIHKKCVCMSPSCDKSHKEVSGRDLGNWLEHHHMECKARLQSDQKDHLSKNSSIKVDALSIALADGTR